MNGETEAGGSVRGGTPDGYFERMWQADDPWDQASRFSELRKYGLTVAALPSARYRRAFEPGCATGILTAMLATRCGQVVATDRHPHAVEMARSRVGHLANVVVEQGRLPDEVPAGPFDLVVYSEVLYYLDRAGVGDALAVAAALTPPGGHLVTVHYRPVVAEHELAGDEVHALVAEASGWRPLVEHREADFVLAVSERL